MQRHEQWTRYAQFLADDFVEAPGQSTHGGIVTILFLLFIHATLINDAPKQRKNDSNLQSRYIYTQANSRIPVLFPTSITSEYNIINAWTKHVNITCFCGENNSFLRGDQCPTVDFCHIRITLNKWKNEVYFMLNNIHYSNVSQSRLGFTKHWFILDNIATHWPRHYSC